jgi:hypothetical protein
MTGRGSDRVDLFRRTDAFYGASVLLHGQPQPLDLRRTPSHPRDVQPGTGFLSLAPTWFLLKLSVEKTPRALLATELLIAAMGPVSWLAMTARAVTTPKGGPSRLPNWPQAARELVGLLIAFGVIPRMIFGPVLLVIEGVTFLLVRERIARGLLAAAMFMNLRAATRGVSFLFFLRSVSQSTQILCYWSFPQLRSTEHGVTIPTGHIEFQEGALSASALE